MFAIKQIPVSKAYVFVIYKEEKRLQRALLEKQLEEEQRLQAQLAAKAAADKKHLVDFLAQEEDRSV